MRRLTSFVLFLFLFYSLRAQDTSSFQKPRLSDHASWSLILLPDPQTYVKFGRNQPIFELMTAWIQEQAKPLHVEMVLCTGDLVEQNNIMNPDGDKVNQPSKAQWESVARSFGRLDGVVPYIAATGNHDYGYRSAENRDSQYDHYFPVDKNPKAQQLLREVGKNIHGNPTLANAAYELASPHGRKYLFLVLEFAPHNGTLEWAKQVVDQEKYEHHRVVLLTHSYIDANNEHIKKENYPLTDANYGEVIFEKLVKPSKNIELVFSGHIGAPDDPKAHVAFRTDKNASGKRVHQMVFNAQALGGGWYGNGGDGWLRWLEFLPDGNSVSVRTFSPLFALSPATQHLAWRSEAYDAFTFELDE